MTEREIIDKAIEAIMLRWSFLWDKTAIRGERENAWEWAVAQTIQTLENIRDKL